METVLITFIVLQSLGTAIFGKFESETAWWKRFIKWLVMLAIILASFYFFGQMVAFVTLIALYALSISFHFYWCCKHSIHPVHATPRKKYYQLRQWKWQEN